MKNTLIIFVFTVLLTGFYNYVGQLVPQKEVHPPPNAEIRAGMSTEEMVIAGKILVDGKGTCLNCHNGSARFPVFDDIGLKAKTRKEGMNDVEYLAEALYDPNGFVVEPFAPGMPPVHKPPIGLSDQEILAVIAYLQSQGSEPTVTLDTKLKYQGAAPAAATPAAAEDAGAAEELSGEVLAGKYGCMACHSFKDPGRMVGPSLYDIGKKMTKPQIYEALMEPDATIAVGFPPGVMGGTLNANGFFDKMTTKQLKTLVDYLVTFQG